MINRVNKLAASFAALSATFCSSALCPSIAWAAPIPESGWGLPRDVSVDGHRIDWLIHATTFFVVLLFATMCIWMLAAVFKHGEGHKAEYDHGDSGHHVAVAMGISAVIFFVVDGNLWFNSTIDVNTKFWNHALPEKHPEAVRIEINAHQWAWDARYAGPDGAFNTADDIVTLNDIRVPVGVPILFQIASVDVIHSFFLPNLRVKQDAMPGMITRLWFTAKETGEFDIGCAQHCGVHHYKMKGQLTILPQEDYQRWAAQMSRIHARGHDPTDEGAKWGWVWKKAGAGDHSTTVSGKKHSAVTPPPIEPMKPTSPAREARN
jgi:cytochrome c oxidase subunit 2